MNKYKEFAEAVYKWLLKKREKDSLFTFSVRQVASKGAETNYFIGTEKSKYFGTTFWYIPVAYPGSASDLINLIFKLNGDNYHYYIQFNQTKSPYDEQNKLALKFIQNLKPKIKQNFKEFKESNSVKKMEYYQISGKKTQYLSIEDLLKDVEIDLEKLIPMIDNEIISAVKVNPKFIAHKITDKEFNNFQEKLNNRIKKHFIGDPKVEVNEKNDLKKNNKVPLNQILYGPPGTGKTYNTINKALAIIENNKGEDLIIESREILKKRFEDYLKEGQIVFTTFHQSMSYEDFIEGIKPIEPKKESESVIYKIIDGIFKKACAIAAYNSYKLYNKSKMKSSKYSFDDLYDAFIISILERIDKRIPIIFKTIRGRDVEVKEINSNNSIIARAKNSVASSSAPLTKENLQKLYDNFKTIDEIEDLQQVKDTVQITPQIGRASCRERV